MKLGWRIFFTCVVVLGILYFMPFIVVSKKDDAGRTWNVPFASHFLQDNNNSITFTNIRSPYSVQKDAENAIYSYEEVKCYGETFYYDEENHISISRYEVLSGFPTRLTYYVQPNNACAGWTVDDEIAWEDGDPLDIPDTLTPEEAMEHYWYVIQDGEIMNLPQYHDFARMVKQGVLCMQRTVLFEGDSFYTIDVQLLEDARIKVTTVKDGEKTEEYYGRYSDAMIDGQSYACVYHGLILEEEPTPLYPCEP